MFRTNPIQNNPNKYRAISLWIKRYRKQHPRSRAIYTYVISHNGGKRRVYRSLVNGSTISMCADYPVTKRVLTWMENQDDTAYNEILEWEASN